MGDKMKINFLNKFFVCLLLWLIIITMFVPYALAMETHLEITSPSAILIELNSGKVLYEKNIHEKMYPASITKILTAIIVIENCDLNDTVTVSNDAIMAVPFGYVTANLQAGETFTVEQLLYVLMVGSSNDSALVLAEHVSGSVEEFASLMNQKAKELGCTESNFINPNGEQNDNHYSSANDLALISKYAMKNEIFRNLVSSTYYSLPPTEKYAKDDRFFTTTNSLLLKNSEQYYKNATGIKTGYTSLAGNCLVASANKNNLELIAIVLNAPSSSDRYNDITVLFEYGYNNYELKEIAKSEKTVHTINVKHATRDTKKLDLSVKNDINVLINKENIDNSIMPEIILNENLKAPLKKGDTVGTIKYVSEGIVYEEPLIANNDVKKSYWYIKFIIFLFIILLFALCFNLSNKKKNKKTKKGGRI